jgi:hypothetical protein
MPKNSSSAFLYGSIRPKILYCDSLSMVSITTPVCPYEPKIKIELLFSLAIIPPD